MRWSILYEYCQRNRFPNFYTRMTHRTVTHRAEAGQPSPTKSISFLFWLAALMVMAGCHSTIENSWGTDAQQQILQAQLSHLHKVEVTVGARVKKLLPDDRNGLPHERF